MKSAFEVMPSFKFSAAILVFAFLFHGSMPSSFSAEPAKKDATSQPSAPKAAVSRLPVQNINDSQNAKVDAVADSLEYQKDTGKLIARGNAVIIYQGTKILADYAEVETDVKKAYARGHVMIFKGDAPRIQGEEVYYDFGNHTGSFPKARAMNDPWFARGEDIQQVREGVDKIQKGSVTTCNLDKPHYEVRFKKATLYVNEKLILYNATVYVLGKPVFWFPWMDVPLNWPNIPVQVMQHYGKKDGEHIGVLKGVTINKNLWGNARVDWRQKRGTGGGWRQYYDYGKLAKGNIALYWTEDKKAPTSLGVNSDGAAAYSFDVLKARPHGRGIILWRHRTDLDDKTSVLLRYNRVADPYFVQEFSEADYRGETQPHSFITTTRNSERYGAMVHLEKRMNSFETMVERMPEVRLDWKNQPFFTDKIFNESRIQFDNAKLMSTAYAKPGNTAIRTDAYSRWYVPLRWKDINLTPYAGYRGTEYSHQLNSGSPKYRSVMDYGGDLRTHFYRQYDVSFDKMGIEVNQLRHIFEPSVAFRGATSTVKHRKLIQFDSIDHLDDAAQLILGLENRLQTKRVVGGKIERVDMVSFNTFLFFEMMPEVYNPNMHSARFSIWENRLVLRPYEWLQLQTRVQFDLASHYLKRTDQDIIFRKGKWRVLFGYSQVHDYYDFYTDMSIQKSQQFIIDARYKLNHLWTTGGYIRWDTSDRNRLNNVDPLNAANTSQGYGVQEWEVSAARDMHDAILEFGVNERHSFVNSATTNKNKMNATVFVKFTMKTLPVGVGSGASQAPFCAPRIGETVAGSNESGGFFDSKIVGGGDSQSLSVH